MPQSRGAILRFLDFGGVHVEFVERLPDAQERPLTAGLGPRISLARARDLLGQPALLPPLAPVPPLHANDGVISVLFLHDGHPMLLAELRPGVHLWKKIALTSAGVHWAELRGAPALWIAGDRHVVVFPHAPPGSPETCSSGSAATSRCASKVRT